MKGLAAAVLAFGVTRTIAQAVTTISINTGTCAPASNGGSGGSASEGSGTATSKGGLTTGTDGIPYESNV